MLTKQIAICLINNEINSKFGIILTIVHINFIVPENKNVTGKVSCH